MRDYAGALAAVRARISRAEQQCNRPPGSVGLIAVSKTCAPAAIRTVAAAGQLRFGESYLSEALPKIDVLAPLGLEWHFIGPIQSNKTRGIAARFDWAHGIDNQKVAQRLSDQRPAGLQPLQVCIQINVSAEPTKSGVKPGDAQALCQLVNRLPGLTLRGLMAIPAPHPEAELRREELQQLSALFRDLLRDGHALDTLSMGMSGDLEEAIAAGATLVRVGSAIFGPRP